MPSALEVSPAAARRFMRTALRFDAPHAGVAAALVYHGYVQLDPINVCGRMHDLILRNRVAGYREHDLLRHLYGPDFETAPPPAPAARGGFEHYAGVLVAFPWEAWPHLQAKMETRRTRRSGWAGKLSKAEEAVAQHILAEITTRGPLTSDDIEHDGRALTAWGTNGRAVKTVLEKLFFHGRVLIATRRNFRRVYDLPERVVPVEIQRAPRPTAAETRRWSVRLTLRQRRLTPLKRDEVPAVASDVLAIRVAGCPLLYCLHEDRPLLERCIAEAAADARPATTPGAAAAASVSGAVRPAPGATTSALRLLAPLDPLIYERRVTRTLWDFPYTWEVYTPPAKRTRGYYALPVLAGHEIVGHVDPKADREKRRLTVVSRRLKRGHVAREAVRELAEFLGLRTTRESTGSLASPPKVD